MDDEEGGLIAKNVIMKAKKTPFSLFNIFKLSDANVAIEIIYHAFSFFFLGGGGGGGFFYAFPDDTIDKKNV